MEIDSDEGSENILYGQAIWEDFTEHVTIKLRSLQLEFRGGLVRLLRKVTRFLRLKPATLHLSSNLLDKCMDARNIPEDELIYYALASICLAAKVNESQATIRKNGIYYNFANTDVINYGNYFLKLEWEIGRHYNWRLSAPTIVTYAMQLLPNMFTDEDTPEDFSEISSVKKKGQKLLEEYLDLTLYDVRLKMLHPADLACSCVACARQDLGFYPWPNRMITITNKTSSTVTPISRLLRRVKSKQSVVKIKTMQRRRRSYSWSW